MLVALSVLVASAGISHTYPLAAQAAERTPAPMAMKAQSGPGLPVAMTGTQPVCQQVSARTVKRLGDRAAHDLAKEPAAKEMKAVLYTEGGCIKPLVVRDQLGNRPAGK